MGAPVVRWQIISPNPDKVSAFYSKVFGWTVSQGNAMGYRELKTGSAEGIQGGVWPAPPEANTFVQLFVQVDDVAATITHVESAGGSVIVPRTALPDGEVMAILRDPTGASFGVVQPAA